MARLRIFLVFGLFTLAFVFSPVRGSGEITIIIILPSYRPLICSRVFCAWSDYSYDSYDDGGYDWGSPSNYFDNEDDIYTETEAETSTIRQNGIPMTITGGGSQSSPNACDWTPMKNSIRGFPSYTLNMISRSSSRAGSQVKGRDGSNASNGWGSSPVGGSVGSGGLFGLGNSRGSSGFGFSNALGRGGNYGMFGSMGSSSSRRGGMFGLNSSWNNYGRSLGNSGYLFPGSGSRRFKTAKSGAQSGTRNAVMQLPNIQPNTGSLCNKCGMSQLSFARTSNWNNLKKH